MEIMTPSVIDKNPKEVHHTQRLNTLKTLNTQINLGHMHQKIGFSQ
jgi:hypothetical protein